MWDSLLVVDKGPLESTLLVPDSVQFSRFGLDLDV